MPALPTAFEVAVFNALTLVAAFALDLVLGDPPESVQRFYPVVWISRLAYFLDVRVRRGNIRREKLFGVLCAVFVIFVFATPCLLIGYLLCLPPPLRYAYVVVGVLVFKMTFTVKGLERFALATLSPNMEKRRVAVAKIVSRDVSQLDVPHLTSATIESTAENLTDSVISPLFYFTAFSAFGSLFHNAALAIFGAMLYRVVNTLDAVFGYKDERYKHFGWFSAKFDDVLNAPLERLAAALLLVSARFLKLQPAAAAGGDGAVKPPIRAAAQALRVRLEKAGHYVVGERFEFPNDEHVRKCIKLVKVSSLVFMAVCVLFLLVFSIKCR
ncbi:MAG: cobalamin biosynthesis protein CobD [Candidatus Alkanophagales archaeon]|nr:MAG: cobalamin biosynthesis protein CobD [Candidatus Alkanophagales archaeon]